MDSEEPGFDSPFRQLRVNLRQKLLCASLRRRDDASFDTRKTSDFLNIDGMHRQIVRLRHLLTDRFIRDAAFDLEAEVGDLSDRSAKYEKRRWVSGRAQAMLIEFLTKERISVEGFLREEDVPSLNRLRRDLAALRARLDPATTTPRNSSHATTLANYDYTQDPNLALHAALTEPLLAQSCGLVTPWIAESTGPLVGDFVIVLDPALFASGAGVDCKATALRRREGSHPLGYKDIDSATSTGLLVQLTDGAGQRRYTATSVNAETAVIQATLLQAGNSISNSSDAGLNLRDDRPPTDLAAEQFGGNEMEAAGLTISGPADDLIVPDALNPATRDASLSCLFLEDLWVGYRLDLGVSGGGSLRSAHRQNRRITLSTSGSALVGETEDFVQREPANQMDKSISTEVLRYSGLNAAQAADYSRFLGTYRPPTLQPGAPFVASADAGLDATQLRFGADYVYRLRTVFQGGSSVEDLDPDLTTDNDHYVQAVRFNRAKSFRPGELVFPEVAPNEEGKPASIFLTANEPRVRLILAPTPVDPDTARYNGQFLSSQREPELDANRSFVKDIARHFKTVGLDAPYYCDPEVSEVTVEIWMRNGDPSSTVRTLLYQAGAYCEVVDPFHVGPIKARFGRSGGWRDFKPIELVLGTSRGLYPTLHVTSDGHRVEVSVPPYAEIDVVLCPVVSEDRVRDALAASEIGLTADWPVVEQRIRVVHCRPGPARSPVLITEGDDFTSRSTFTAILRRDRLAAVAQFVGRVDLDAASTGSLQIEAAWNEIDDNPLYPKYSLQKGTCASIPRSLVFNEYEAPTAGLHSSPVAAGSIAAALQMIGQQCSENKVFLGTTPVAQAGGQAVASCTLPLPDARRRQLSCVAIGLGRYASHFKGGTASSSASRSPTILGDVPASLALPAPQISHILPIVRQINSKEGGTHESRRVYGFRIYVQRPWFVSGIGERLAIGCHTGLPPTGPHDTLNKRFTQWGEDPIQRMKLVATRDLPRANDFRSATSDHPTAPDSSLYPPGSPEGTEPVLYFDDVVRDLESADTDDSRLALASLALKWDAQDRLWFCDVELTKPFAGWIGMALYRHQPHAHEGLQLSTNARWVYSTVIQGEQVTWVVQDQLVHVTIGPIFDKTLSFEAETRYFRSGVSKRLDESDSTRQAFQSFTVDNRIYFEGYFDVGAEAMRIVRRRFDADISIFTLQEDN